jgi:hypothetical protein
MRDDSPRHEEYKVGGGGESQSAGQARARRLKHVRLGYLKAKSVEFHDETRTFEKGKVDIVSIDEVTAGRFTLEPGWKGSECVKPIVGTDSCQALHTGYVVSGRMHFVHDDGSERELGPGDVYIIRPGHDAWIVSEEPYVGVDFSSETERYAKEG